MKPKLFFLFYVSLVLCGCGPTLSHTKDYSLAVGDIIEVPLNPVSSDQTIKVTATSPGKPIKVHVYAAEHADAVNDAILMDKPSEHLLAGEDGAEEVSLEAKIPAGTEAVVRIQPAGPTSAEVHLEITN